MKEQVIERDREIARLKHELAKQADGSLFDLKHDSADDCAGAIVANLSTHKAMNPADGILARLKKSQKRGAISRRRISSASCRCVISKPGLPGLRPRKNWPPNSPGRHCQGDQGTAARDQSKLPRRVKS